ncbi:MAG: hypothetical protein R3D33_13685 [Hyphomicrobiaceae bacterium]
MWHQLMARLRSWLPEIEPCVTWRNGQAAPICMLRLPGPADGRGASAPKIEAGEAGVACVVSSRAGPIHGELAVHRNGADGPVWADLIGCLAVHRERLVQALDFASLVLELSVGLGIVKALLEADGHAAVIIGPDCSTLYYNGAAEAEFAAGDLLMRAPDGRLRLPGLVEPSKFEKLIAAALTSGQPVGAPCRSRKDLEAIHAVKVTPLHQVASELGGAGGERAAYLKVSLRRSDRFARVPPRTIVEMLGFTETEAKIASFIAGGGSPKGFTQQHGGEIATVRWHLSNINRRLDCASQVELVSCVLNMCR